MLAAGVSTTVAATIALAPLPTESLPATQTVPVALTGAWQDLQTNLQQDLGNLASLIVNYPPAPILTQIAKNFTTYSRWLVGEDGGDPLKIVQTMSDHAAAVAGVMVTFGLLMPLSFVGPFIAPGIMLVQLVADTSRYPSTPQTVLQAFIDAPAVYLNTTFNCCSTPLVQLAFGLLNPGPLGYFLSLGPAIATALQITTPESEAAAGAATASAVSAAQARSGVAQSRRSQPATAAPKAVASRSAKRPRATHKNADARQTTPSSGKGQSARPASPGTR
ncbi:hypothetical protein FHT40_001075 [Mycolicibacterium sp. BK556]|uniref:hypothetical protein n=1 Tax=Mycobacteriaceae TaxID=1762 RepID=UPI00105C26AF|nr:MULTISPECIES: hypothetical protein [Mycobacteriaceae]MBB3601442.1 hypothetical protein [Mycolicibacterium sp. BK556]MBB3631194.1 hypothetical protein [Mycolicibacterium sp. BK607]MBB3749197.1 hypothetical protein [Mycolicibacterium sp. BK634]TDO14583.1 hypothetical protein EV580_2713 [Mycobacterium sp. BK086]